MTRALGIDPGTHRIGWGIVDKSGQRYQVTAHGCLQFPPHSPASVYLPRLFDEINLLLSTHHPQRVGLEKLLFQKNVTTALPVSEARGVILLSAALADVPVTELAPNTIKLTLTGYGSANKPAVARMVGLLLGIKTEGLLDDTLDALAIAYACLS